MASTVDKVQARLQEAMEQRNQASLGQAIDASKGVNGLKQLRRSAKVKKKCFLVEEKRLNTSLNQSIKAISPLVLPIGHCHQCYQSIGIVY